jgi:MFS family permease
MSATTTVADVRRIARGPVRRLYVGQFVKSLGAGMTLAQLMIYLTKVRDISIPMATGLLAWQAVLALMCSPVVGTLVDKYGPRLILMGGALMTALGIASYAWIQDGSTTQALLATTVVAIAGAAIWGPSSALLARLVPPADRSTAFGFEFMLLNLGLGLGALIGSAFVNTAEPMTYMVLFWVNALAFVALFLAVLSMGDVGRLTPTQEHPDAAPGTHPAAGWREVLADVTLRRYVVVGLLLLTCGYGSIDGGLGLYLTDGSVGLRENAVSVVFAANTAVIVVMQLVSLTVIRGRRRSRVMATVGALWAVSWVLFGLASGPSASWVVLGVAVLAMMVFALGETLWSPVAPALLNDLAPEHLRGRYNSVQSLLWGVAGAFGPLLAGQLLDRSLGMAWSIVLASGCLLGALLALRMGRSLTPEQEGLARDTPGEPSEAEREPVH